MDKKTTILIIFLCIVFTGNTYSSNQTMKTTDAQVDQAGFLKGYELFSDQDYIEACPYLYQYISAYSPDDQDYEWAEFFLGVSLQKLGYTHAATDILAKLVSRNPNPKIVEYCLEIFEDMIKTQPIDIDLIIHQTICDQEYGFIKGDLADFIHYYQGIYDWEHGFFSWGNDHFARISPESYYHYKYRYQQALLYVYQDKIHDAIPVLKDILKGKCKDETLKDDARKTLARLLYELSKYEEADLLYLEIEENILSQSQNLLERAWAHYRLGHPEKAMGLLYAFEAPSFRHNFTPEYYMLKSFIYKDVCHYQSALNVVSEFRQRYGDSLGGIYHRGKISENKELLLILLGRKDIKALWDFISLLEAERAKCSTFKDEQDNAFYEYLDNIYALQLLESSSILRIRVEAEYERYADSLLQYEEEAHLMAYEIGLDMYQRVNQYHYSQDQEKAEEESDRVVVYPFQGEFWNDELEDLKVVLPNKCKNMEEWDIFFK